MSITVCTYLREIKSKCVSSYRYADQVLVGDEVLVQGIDNLIPAKVINVSSLNMQGDLCSFIYFAFSLFIIHSTFIR